MCKLVCKFSNKIHKKIERMVGNSGAVNHNYTSQQNAFLIQIIAQHPGKNLAKKKSNGFWAKITISFNEKYNTNLTKHAIQSREDQLV